MVENRVNIVILVIAFILLLIIGFEYFIPSTLVDHRPFNVFILSNFVILSLVPITWIPITSSRPSTLIIWILYLVVIIPSIIFPYLSVEYDTEKFFLFSLTLLLCFYIICNYQKFQLLSVSKLNISNRVYYIIFFAIYFYFVINIIRTFGFNFQLVSLRDVYDVRSEYKDQLAEANFSSTNIRWLLFVLNPLLIVNGYLKNKYWMLIVGLVGELFIYSFSGLKSSLFIGFVLLILLYVFKNKLKSINNLSIVILKCVIILIFVILLCDYMFFSDSFLYKDILSSLIIRRNFVIPGNLSGHYFHFFDTHPKNYMSNNSLFGILVNYDSPYNNQSPPEIIGAFAFGDHVPHANASFLADAFAQYGYLGMIIYSFLVGGILFLYDSIVRNINKIVAIIMLVPFAFTFSNSAFFTVLFGHGFLFFLVIIYIYSCNENFNTKRI